MRGVRAATLSAARYEDASPMNEMPVAQGFALRGNLADLS